MKATHPFLQAAVVGVDIIGMELWLAGLWTAGGWQHMQLDPRAPGEGTHAHAAIAAELGLWRKGLYGSAARPKAASRA